MLFVHFLKSISQEQKCDYFTDIWILLSHQLCAIKQEIKTSLGIHLEPVLIENMREKLEGSCGTF